LKLENICINVDLRMTNGITNTDITLFADCLFKSGRKLDVIIRYIQKSLNALAEWCDLNGFKISLDKTVAVLFTHRREGIESTLKINDDYVKVEKKAKFLGLVFDSKLTWKEHVDYVVDKCKKTFKFYEGDCRK